MSFTLINAASNAEMHSIEDGGTVSIAPGSSINVRADTSPDYPTDSVRFALNGNANFRTEGAAPFALAGDACGDYFPWQFSYGPQVLRATPYTGPGASGTAGTAREITFTIISEYL
jgi:hypothetical protein